MTEAQWVRLFVQQMLKLRGKKAEPEAIEDLARSLYPVFRDVSPAEAADREARRALPKE